MHYYYYVHHPFLLKQFYFFLFSITLTSLDDDESCIADLDREIVDGSLTCLVGLGS